MMLDLLLWLHVRLEAGLHARLHDHGRDRGDVPGWVLITLMTAGIVTAIWTFAGDRLVSIVRDALDSVAPTGS